MRANRPYHMVNSGIVNSEGKKLRALLRCVMRADRTFARIWQGKVQIHQAHVSLRSEWGVDARGRLIYNGKLYNKDCWGVYAEGNMFYYGPPKFIRLQGRSAKEDINPRNTHPEVIIFTEDGQQMVVDRCPKCGGELVDDNSLELYCRECGLMY